MNNTTSQKTQFMDETIVDEEITLSPMRNIHAPALFSIIDNDRAYIRRYQNWPDYVITLRDMQELINDSVMKRANGNGFDMTIQFRGHIVGKIGLVYIKWDERRAEIGYWLAKPYQGHGIITRSCKTLLDFAFTQLKLECIQIRCAVGNVRSAAIAKRLQFQEGGIAASPTWIRGVMHREVVYNMFSVDWNRLRNE